MRRKLLFVFLLFVTAVYFGQGEGNNWYFGNYAGLSFSTDPPTILNDGRLITTEGSASVSDKDGNLVFYTDGSTVFDANHNVMPNGTGLTGSRSSTQSAIISPKPGTYNYSLKRYDNYIIVTIDYGRGGNGVRFSEVDMTLNGGTGDIVNGSKNTLLFGTTTMEGANLAKHANGCDYWIIGKPVDNNNVLAYSLTSSGVNMTPVVSTTGPVIGSGWGSIKVSSNSKFVGIASNGSSRNRTNVYDFNNATGFVTHRYTANIGGYSLEFSPNSNVLYSTYLNDQNIYQFDLTTTTQTDFLASQTIIGTTANNERYKMCGIQLGPNGKIYAALQNQTRLGVINSPNVLGTGCNYNDNGVLIGGVNSFNNENMSSKLGLPAFPSFLLIAEKKIQSSYLCFNDQTNLKLNNVDDVNNIDWFWTSVGTALPSSPNSNVLEPLIQFSSPGEYAVMAAVHYPCYIDSIIDTITITAVNDVNLGNDTVFCEGGNLTLDAGVGYDFYTWHNGDDSQTFFADTTGEYIVEVANIGQNLIVNGDFEDGNVGFSSDYEYFTTTNTGEGQYTVNTSPPVHNGAWSNCPDHTTGSGNMMIVNGAITPNEFVWCQEIQVSQNTDYVFSLWGQAIYNLDPGVLQFSINGMPVGDLLNFNSTTCQWEQFYEIWNSGTNTTIEVCILNQNTGNGNDFAIDDIFFAPLCKTSDTINVLVGDIPTAQFSLVDSCEYDAVVYTDESTVTFPQAITGWSWDVDNDGTQDYNTQNPSHFFTTGNYTTKLEVTTNLGCKKDTIMNVLTYAKPQSNFTYQSDCAYDSLSFTGSTNGTDYFIASHGWNFGESITPPIQSVLVNPYYTYSTSGDYQVTEIIVTTDGCLDTLTQTVEVYEIPNANFNTGSVCQEAIANFTNASTITNGTIDNWNWEFGNTLTGILENETTNYDTSGVYEVELVVTSNNNCVDTILKNIEIYPLPIAQFSLVDSCEYDAVVYTDGSSVLGSTISQWSWDIDNDGIEDYSTQNSTHAFTAGNYISKLTVTSALGCAKDTTMPVLVFPKPTANFTFQPKCLYDSLLFVDASTVLNDVISTHAWNFGESVTHPVQSTSSTPYYTFNNYGPQNITEIVGTANGCFDSISQTVEVFEVPIANFSTNNVCQDTTAEFIDLSSINSGIIIDWNWSFGDNSTGNYQNETNNYNSDGTFTVELIVSTANSCKDTTSQSIIIHPVPIANFITNNDCLEEAIPFTDASTINTPSNIAQWIWDFDDQSNPSTIQSPTYVYQNDGEYDVTLTVISNENCTDEIQQSVTVYPLPEVSYVASEVCVNELPTQFTNTSVITAGSNTGFSWSFGDVNNSNSAQENPSFNYEQHGDYEVSLEVISDQGCVSFLIDTITVKHKPTAIFTQDTTGGCAPICINFISNSEDSLAITGWNWQFENVLREGSNKFEGYCYNAAGTYDVKLIVENSVGCFDTVESLSLINTFDFPISDFEVTPNITTIDNPTVSIVNQSIDDVRWVWDFADGSLDSTNYDPTYSYADTGSYIIELLAYSANGCSTKSYREVIVLPVDNVFVPSAFSPNGDGENDMLFVRGYLSGIYFSVYDRWGKKVFETTNQEQGWDGMIKGKPAMEGVYMWYLQTSFNGEPKKFKGDISLMR